MSPLPLLAGGCVLALPVRTPALPLRDAPRSGPTASLPETGWLSVRASGPKTGTPFSGCAMRVCVIGHIPQTWPVFRAVRPWGRTDSLPFGRGSGRGLCALGIGLRAVAGRGFGTAFGDWIWGPSAGWAHQLRPGQRAARGPVRGAELCSLAGVLAYSAKGGVTEGPTMRGGVRSIPGGPGGRPTFSAARASPGRRLRPHSPFPPATRFASRSLMNARRTRDRSDDLIPVSVSAVAVGETP